MDDDWKNIPADQHTPEQAAQAKAAHEKAIRDFNKGFVKALDEEKSESGKGPKVHDPKKGEFVQEVDPKVADR